MLGCMQRLWAWISAFLGLVILVILVILVVDYVDGAILGTWFDEHTVFDAPDVIGEFFIVGLGLVLLVGGVLTAVLPRRTADHSSARQQIGYRAGEALLMVSRRMRIRPWTLTLLIVLAACGVGLFVLPPGVPTKIVGAACVVLAFVVLSFSERAGRSGR